MDDQGNRRDNSIRPWALRLDGRDRSGRSAFVAGAVAAAALGLILAAAFGGYADTTSGEGATAEILETALGILVGAAMGLAIGAAVGAALAPARNVLVGLAAGAVPYAVVLTPIYLLTLPEGDSAGEAARVAAYLVGPVLLVVLVGAIVGWVARRLMFR